MSLRFFLVARETKTGKEKMGKLFEKKVAKSWKCEKLGKKLEMWENEKNRENF